MPDNINFYNLVSDAKHALEIGETHVALKTMQLVLENSENLAVEEQKEVDALATAALLAHLQKKNKLSAHQVQELLNT